MFGKPVPVVIVYVKLQINNDLYNTLYKKYVIYFHSK